MFITCADTPMQFVANTKPVINPAALQLFISALLKAGVLKRSPSNIKNTWNSGIYCNTNLQYGC